MDRRRFLNLTAAGFVGGCGALVESAECLGKPDAKVPLWLDTDIGGDIDDAVCLFCAIHHPRVELLGVSTVRGCIGSVRAATWVAAKMLKLAGRPNVPVLPGSRRALDGTGRYDSSGTYGGLAPKAKPLSASPEADDARINAIAKAMRAAGKPFHLLTVGPVTNAARLAVRYPEVAKRWQSVTCMAGDLDNKPECNARLDGRAYQWVCRHLAPRLVGNQCGGAIAREDAERALDRSDPASDFLLKCYATYRKMADWDKAPPERRPLTIIDAVTLLSILHPGLYDFQNIRTRVEPNGFIGRDANGVPVRYAMSAKMNEVKHIILNLLARKQPTVGGERTTSAD